jgi:hypothetical protein
MKAAVTTVVNIHHKVPYDVYIGRAGHGEDGYFGNPCRTDKRCVVCGDTHLTRENVVDCYEMNYFHRRLGIDPEFRRRVRGLQGLRLGCFCAPKACHGDVIAAYCNALGARERPKRRDIAALEEIRASRANNPFWRMPRGARYVVGDEEYEIWAIRPLSKGGIVLRSVRRANSFLMEECSGPFDPARWRY